MNSNSRIQIEELEYKNTDIRIVIVEYSEKNRNSTDRRIEKVKYR